MENLKYKLTDEKKVVDNTTLHRIECVTSFGDVECGEKGGWIESEKNLSQDGNAWVYDNATVFGHATVRENAWVYDNATVCGHATVRENAWVGGHATVRENATVIGTAWVDDNAVVRGNAVVFDNAVVSGTATVDGNAKVGGNATVGGDAWVDDNAKVLGNADYIVFKNWWSSGRFFTWTRSNNKWKIDCFYGSGEELIAKAYKDSEKSGREYERVVKYVESILKEEDNNQKQTNKVRNN